MNEDKKLKINIIGDIFSTTGYASHTRNLVNALYKIADVKLSTQLMQGWERMVNDNELDMITKQGKENDIQIIITTPHMWKLFLGTGINCAYCVWEGSKVPLSYIDEMLNPKIDLIFVPSEHTKQAIENTINDYEKEIMTSTQGLEILDKIKVIPHGVDLSIFKSLEKKHDKFTFVCNKGWRGSSWDRGGVQYMIKAFNEEFTMEDNIRLIVRLNPAYISPQMLQQSVQQLNLQANKADIQVMLENVPYDKLCDFYNLGDAYICPTRSEAFDLGSGEAMACGLPVIATNYGGQIEHMDSTCALFVDAELSEVKEDIMYEGIEWATIVINDLRKKMRWCYEHQDRVKEMGLKAKEFITIFTWNNSANRIIESIKQLFN